MCRSADPVFASCALSLSLSLSLSLTPGLLRDDEVEQLRDRFDALGRKAADGARAAETHASVIVEDGRVVCPDLYGILDEALEQRILPYVRARTGAPHVAVADVLLRAYRHEDGRQALAPHFDASSYCTVIIPLNPGEYGGGLYVQEGADAASRLLVDSSFERGDALMHRYDVMHGVEVTSGSRYSLVLWLGDCAASVRTGSAPWLAGAASAGSAYAQFLLAEALKAGRHGYGQNAAGAAELQQRAAAQGHALSQHQLGMLFLTGNGVPKDGARCGQLWRAAAEAGLAAAQASMGMCHVDGRLGCHVDEEAAVGWYERAARQGHAEAADLLRAWRKYGRFG